MPVAKSYRDLPRLCEPFEVNGKMYTKVKLNSGKEKTCRWYTDYEYKTLYGEAAAPAPKELPTRCEALGFGQGAITIFKGNTFPYLDYFRNSNAKYNKQFGWHFISGEDLPEDLPEDLIPIKLEWEQIANGDELKSETAIKVIIESLIYDPTESQYVGAIGERVEFTATLEKIIPFDGYYGASNMFIFKSKEGNEFVWSTSTNKNFQIGNEYHLKGTIKDLKIYRGSKQNIMSRVVEV